MSTRHLPVIGGHPTTFGGTLRTDNWRLGPIATVCMISGAIAYLTWAMFQGNHYYAAPYLSPIYSPVLFTNSAYRAQLRSSTPGSARGPTWWPSLLLAGLPWLSDFAVPGALPLHLLLLPEGVLPLLWRLASRLCGEPGASPHLSRRNAPVPVSEPAPLRALHRAHLRGDPRLRRGPGLLQARPVRRRCRHARAADQHRADLVLHASAATPSGT